MPGNTGGVIFPKENQSVNNGGKARWVDRCNGAKTCKLILNANIRSGNSSLHNYFKWLVVHVSNYVQRFKHQEWLDYDPSTFIFHFLRGTLLLLLLSLTSQDGPAIPGFKLPTPPPPEDGSKENMSSALSGPSRI